LAPILSAFLTIRLRAVPTPKVVLASTSPSICTIT
jgi:hypothetical protein